MLLCESDTALRLISHLAEKGYINNSAWEKRELVETWKKGKLVEKGEYVVVRDIDDYKNIAQQLESIAATAQKYNVLVVRSGSELEAEILEDKISQDRYLQLEPWMYKVAKALFV